MALLEEEPLKPFEFKQFPLRLSSQTMRVFDDAEIIARWRYRSHIIPADIFAALVRTQTDIQDALKTLKIPAEEFVSELIKNSAGLKHPSGTPPELLFNPVAFSIIKGAERIAEEKKSLFLEPIHIFSSYAEWNEGFAPHILKDKYGLTLETVLFQTRKLMQRSSTA